MKKNNIAMASLQVPFLVNAILQNLRVQKKFIKKNIEPHLNDAWKNNDGSIEENDNIIFLNAADIVFPGII
ncbi:MAG TPA: hypothetical protein VK484_13325 [Ferruginibacter sp.]|nr:hypothetical protein [Ferruginibacter sp.]